MADGEGGIFFAENGLVVFTDPGWIQLAFNIMTGLFDRVGLWTNV